MRSPFQGSALQGASFEQCLCLRRSSPRPGSLRRTGCSPPPAGPQYTVSMLLPRKNAHISWQPTDDSPLAPTSVSSHLPTGRARFEPLSLSPLPSSFLPPLPLSAVARVILAPHAQLSSFLHSTPLNMCQKLCSANEGPLGACMGSYPGTSVSWSCCRVLRDSHLHSPSPFSFSSSFFCK